MGPRDDHSGTWVGSLGFRAQGGLGFRGLGLNYIRYPSTMSMGLSRECWSLYWDFFITL